MMREIRDELSKKYNEDPEAFMKELEEINKKYSIKEKTEKKIKNE